MRVIVSLLALLWGHVAFAQDAQSFQEPPSVIKDLLLAKPTPHVSISPNGKWMVLFDREALESLEALAQPELRIAGMRLNPSIFGSSRESYNTGLQLRSLEDTVAVPIQNLPKPLQISSARWNADGSLLAFLQVESDRTDLYVLDVNLKTVRKVNQAPVHTVFGSYTWVSNQALVYKVVPATAGSMPQAPLVPKGPVIQEHLGQKAPSRTIQDLLKSPYDEDVFTWIATSQLVYNDLKEERPIGKPAIWSTVNPSPDGQYILLRKLMQPYSYLVSANGFPSAWEVWDLQGRLVKALVQTPSSENAPIGFDNVVVHPRNYNWRNDEPHTITYVQALDGGLGRNKADYRDALLQINMRAVNNVDTLLKTKRRFSRVVWGDAQTALIYESTFAQRMETISLFNPRTKALQTLLDRNTEDKYNELGSPVLVPNTYNQMVLYKDKKGHFLFTSDGASDEGDMPLLQQFDPKTGEKKILWRSVAPYYERVVQMLDADKGLFVTLREGTETIPNYYVRDLRKRSLLGKQVTYFESPYTALAGVHREKLTYKRSDGLQLSGDLYLPAGYDAQKEGPLPILIWAYPREFKSTDGASQVRGSKYTFTRPAYGGPIFWVTQGFAVLNNAEMPIIGEGNEEPNDHFIPQLYMNAHAAIQALAQKGVGDSTRVGVGGHSYGAFMTANLLAHTNLFNAGIARSGAYNRTLTPFGFQYEQRTYWEAPEVYFNMAPFNFAHQIKTPILLIHGELDNNAGTFPIQSERLYNAIKGHGGTVRYVQLPYESHGYAAKENILHMLWEQDTWLKKYVRDAHK
jgi:dipeptidyl aminopeptidase/acylaminoacyl peptidase